MVVAFPKILKKKKRIIDFWGCQVENSIFKFFRGILGPYKKISQKIPNLDFSKNEKKKLMQNN